MLNFSRFFFHFNCTLVEAEHSGTDKTLLKLEDSLDV